MSGQQVDGLDVTARQRLRAGSCGWLPVFRAETSYTSLENEHASDPDGNDLAG